MDTKTTPKQAGSDLPADGLRAAIGGVGNPDMRSGVGDPDIRPAARAVVNPDIRAVQGSASNAIGSPDMRTGVGDPDMRRRITAVGDPEIRIAQGGGDGSVRDPEIRGVIAIIAVRMVVNPEIRPS